MYIMIYIYIHTDTLFVTNDDGSHRRAISSSPAGTRVARVLTYLTFVPRAKVERNLASYRRRFL